MLQQRIAETFRLTFWYFINFPQHFKNLVELYPSTTRPLPKGSLSSYGCVLIRHEAESELHTSLDSLFVYSDEFSRASCGQSLRAPQLVLLRSVQSVVPFHLPR